MELVLVALVALVVLGSVLALGAVHVVVLVLIAPLAFVACALGLWLERKRGEEPQTYLLAWIGALVGGYTLLQALPLPMGLLVQLAPANADVWARALLPFGEEGPKFASISMDPGATLVEALKWASYAALFRSTVSVSRRFGAAVSTSIVFVSALLVAIATVLHGLFAATKVYGFYVPSVPLPPWHVGPLINTNTLAGYLNLGAFVGAGLVLRHEPIVPRPVLALAVALLVAVEVTSASRGGVLTLILGVLVLVVLLRIKASHQPERGRDKPYRALLLAGGALLFGAMLAALGGTADTWSELYDKNLSKLEMLLWVKPLVREHAWVGIGRGAFESVFPAYRLTEGHVVYAYAENFLAQWASEWGLPVALFAVGGFGYAARPSQLGALRSGLAAAVFAGVVALLVQNLVDLSLEIPAVCYALAVLLGSLVGERARSRRQRAEAEPKRSRLLPYRPALTVAFGFVLSLLAYRVGVPEVSAERDRVRRLFDAGSDVSSRAELRAALRRAMLRHPAEPYFSLVGALSVFQSKSESALPWLQRTLERGHENGRAHLLLAEVLASRGARRQALLELRIASEQDRALVGHAGALAFRYTRDFDELLIAVPEGDRGANMLDELGVQARNAGQEALRSRIDRAAIERSASVYGPRIREAEALLSAIGSGALSTSGCADRAQCFERVEEHARSLTRSHASESVGDRLRAKLLLVDGKPEAAEALLAARCAEVKDRAVCLRARAEAAVKVTDAERLDAASKELLATECLSAMSCAEAASFLASLRQSRGESATALSLLERAAREDPSDKRLVQFAVAASRAGAHARAADAYERAAQKRGGDASLREKAALERALAMGVKPSP